MAKMNPRGEVSDDDRPGHRRLAHHPPSMALRSMERRRRRRLPRWLRDRWRDWALPAWGGVAVGGHAPTVVSLLIGPD